MAAPQRNTAYGVIALLGLVTAGVLLYNYATTPKDQSPLPRTYAIQAVCLACTKEANLTRSVVDVPPFLCPHCGKRALVGWYYCPACAKRFAPPLEIAEGEAARLAMKIVCPSCGNEAVGARTAADPTQKPTGDLPLPKWPPIATTSPSTMPASLPTSHPAKERDEQNP